MYCTKELPCCLLSLWTCISCTAAHFLASISWKNVRAPEETSVYLIIKARFSGLRDYCTECSFIYSTYSLYVPRPKLQFHTSTCVTFYRKSTLETDWSSAQRPSPKIKLKLPQRSQRTAMLWRVGESECLVTKVAPCVTSVEVLLPLHSAGTGKVNHGCDGYCGKIGTRIAQSGEIALSALWMFDRVISVKSPLGCSLGFNGLLWLRFSQYQMFSSISLIQTSSVTIQKFPFSTGNNSSGLF